MSVELTKMLSILKNLFRITMAVIILFLMLPFFVVWFSFLFLKFVIEYEVESSPRG
jgi:hypothetical protein